MPAIEDDHQRAIGTSGRRADLGAILRAEHEIGRFFGAPVDQRAGVKCSAAAHEEQGDKN